MADYYHRYDARDDFDGRRRGRDAPTRYTEAVYVRGRGVGTPARQMELIRRPESGMDVSLEETQSDYAARPTYDRRVSRSLDRSEQANAFAYEARYGDDPRGSADDIRRSRRPRRPRSRGRSLSRTQELAAAAAGAGLALGGQELWNRREGDKKRQRSKSRLGQVAVGLAGAAAGDLAAKEFVKDRERRRRHDGYDDDGDDNRPRLKNHRRKSLVERGEAALEAFGLGAVTGSHHDRDRDYDRARDRGRGRYDYDDDGDDGGRRRRRHPSSDASDYSSRSRSRPRGGSMDRNKRLQQAAQAAITAAAVEAWRGRKEPGGLFEGPKARRILTAAVGAGGIDAVVDKNPDRHGGRHVGEGAIGGLLLNQFVNGSGSGRRRSRSRSRSAGGTLKNIAAAGMAAGLGKKILDRPRSRSRSRHRRRYSSDSSSVDDRRPRRSKSVTDYIDDGMSKLGIGGRDRNRRRRRDRDRDRDGGEIGVRSSPYTDDEYSQTQRTVSGGGLPRDGPSSRRDGQRRRQRGNRNRSNSSSSSSRNTRNNQSESEFSLSEEEKSHRKLKGKEYLSAGLATVATVHAAHEIYESMEKRKKRLEAVRTGKLSPTRAKSMKRKAQMKDLTALTLAGLSLKGVAESWKETHHQRREIREFETKLEKHRRIAAERRARNQRGGGADGVGGGVTSSSPSAGQARSRRNSFAGPVYDGGNPYGSWRD